MLANRSAYFNIRLISSIEWAKSGPWPLCLCQTALTENATSFTNIALSAVHLKSRVKATSWVADNTFHWQCTTKRRVFGSDSFAGAALAFTCGLFMPVCSLSNAILSCINLLKNRSSVLAPSDLVLLIPPEKTVICLSERKRRKKKVGITLKLKNLVDC